MGPEILDSQQREIQRAPIDKVKVLLQTEINKVIEGDLGEYSVLVGRWEYPSGREVIFYQLPKEIEPVNGKRVIIDIHSVDVAFRQIVEEQLGVDFLLVSECLEDEWDQKIDRDYDHTIFEWQFSTAKDNVLVVFKEHVAAIGKMGWEWAVRNTHPKGLGTRIKEGAQKRLTRFPIINFPY